MMKRKLLGRVAIVAIVTIVHEVMFDEWYFSFILIYG